jgi:ABC-2 type transport system permease protein
MTELLVFEWRRMRSLGATWVLVGLVVGFALLADVAVGLGKFHQPVDAEGVAFLVVQRDLIIRWLVAAAIGAQAFGHEFRYGTIRPTLLAFPRRGQLLAGKVIATSLLSAAAALAASAVSIALVLVLTTWDRSVFADPRLWRSITLGILTAGLVAALAVGLAALTRSSGLPIVVIVLWAGVVEPLAVVGLGGGAARVLPFLSLVQLTASSPVSQDLGAPGPLVWVVFPLCLVATLATALLVLTKRDVAHPRMGGNGHGGGGPPEPVGAVTLSMPLTCCFASVRKSIRITVMAWLVLWSSKPSQAAA